MGILRKLLDWFKKFNAVSRPSLVGVATDDIASDEAPTAKIVTRRHTGGIMSTPSERVRRFSEDTPSGMSVTEMLEKTLAEQRVGPLSSLDDTATAPPPRKKSSDPELEALSEALERSEAELVAERAALHAEFERNERLRKRYDKQRQLRSQERMA